MDEEAVFGEVLRRLRRQKSLSQEQLAFESGINRQFVSLLELGERSPSLATLYKLSAGLGISGSEFLRQIELHPDAAKSAKRGPHSAKKKRATGR